MREHEMNDAQDLDPSAEAAGRRLLTAAFETVSADGADGGLTHGDLLRQVRRRTSQRRRVRTLVPAGAVLALGGVIALVVALTVAGAPSAAAAVTAAAAKTSAETVFSVTSTQYQTNTLSAEDNGPTDTMTGVFDLGRGLGEETVDGTAARIVGGHLYVDLAGTNRVFAQRLAHGKTWVEGLESPSALRDLSLSASSGFAGDEPINPGALLGLLKSAGSVTAEGPASGPGWTGTTYAFAEQLPSGEDAPIIVHGTVCVDHQGRVRRLVTAQTRVIWSSEGVKGSATEYYDVTFGKFGVPVSVSAPPPSQVYNIGQEFMYLNVFGGLAFSGPHPPLRPR